MKSFEITATKRTDLTKQETKKIRTGGQVPCVLYGGKENVHFSAPVLSFKGLVYTPEVYKVNLNIDGQTHEAVMREVQFHPVTDKLLHIDFMAIHPDKEVTIDIPVKITGSADGVRQGGQLIVKVRTLQVSALPAKLPGHVEVDVTPLQIGQSVRIGDLKMEGVTFLDSPNNIITGVRVTRNVVETPAEAAKTAAPAAAAAPAPAPAAK